MENLLISPDEVIELAFSPNDQIDPAIITDTRIETAQLKFLAPILGKMYAALDKGLYPEFNVTYIKPVLAHFVKYNIFLNLSVRIGNDGIIRIKTPDSVPADSSDIARLRRESREYAYLLLQKAFKHLNKNQADFPEFEPKLNKNKRLRMNGGIVF